jgi:hypothetical protein
MEPISPELALIDPELARTHLAWLESGARLPQAPGVWLPRSGSPTPLLPRRTVPWWTVAKIAAAVSLAANGFLVAFVVARDRPAAAAQSPADTFAVPAPVTGSGAIEQRILSLVAASERGRLPSTLVDAATGLPKNNLQAICHGRDSASKLCVVRPARHRPGEGLYVRYTPSTDGAGRFTWYPYRAG